MRRTLQLLPMLRTEHELPTLSTDAKLPTLNSDTALATDSMLAQLRTDHRLRELAMDPPDGTPVGTRAAVRRSLMASTAGFTYPPDSGANRFDDQAVVDRSTLRAA